MPMYALIRSSFGGQSTVEVVLLAPYASNSALELTEHVVSSPELVASVVIGPFLVFLIFSFDPVVESWAVAVLAMASMYVVTNIIPKPACNPIKK